MTRTYDKRNRQKAIILAKNSVSVSKLYLKRQKTAHRQVHLIHATPPAGSNIGGHYQKLYIQSRVPDDGAKTSPETCRADWE